MPSSAEANLPPTNEGYGTHEYCEADGTTFDWFLSPTYLLPLFEQLTSSSGNDNNGKGKGKETRILTLGCGNSALGEVLYDNGWENIVNIDYSKIVIDQMRERHTARPNMKWLEMDILNLGFQDEEFDLVVDKGVWCPSCFTHKFHFSTKD
uniref:Methyltransferase domain-containing protein n=1 Tax=Kwoniella dejecticola CBS 10117 TaxID=1296121 RepID=A0A1A6ACH9_9TREE|nr:uncharacterized protein I303_01972 [Kwoniella dejecticola CBS 10117]OBR87760.1 hypothetical protein I303_01972 [Kwoniella dejecticola CBS 10117]